MITVHILVKNEGRFIWYSVMSVINSVDKVRIWDMGSKDKTRLVIDEILNINKFKNKIFYKKFDTDGFFDEQRYRQQMLDLDLQEVKGNDGLNWVIVVDGDEIWWNDSINKVVSQIKLKNNKIESIVVPSINLVGDMYHYQEAKAGHYHLAGRTGHYNLRAFNLRIPGIHSSKPHGTWGWTDINEKMIQDRSQKKIVFIDAPYLHATHLQRSDVSSRDFEVYKRSRKLKHELGIEFAKDFFYPEVFFIPKLKIVSNVWKKMNSLFYLVSLIETPLRKFKRRYMKINEGY